MSLIAALALVSTLTMSESAPLPKIVAQPFALSEVKLLGGPFAHAHKVLVDYLLTVDPHRLLHSFRKNAGLEPKAEIYQGWENTGLAGHSLGHYLTACAQEYASSRDPRFKTKIDLIVAELDECQAARKDGYLGAMPDGDRVWAEVKAGNIRSGGFDLNGLWSPWYTHHKVFAGLLDAYRLAGNKKALEVVAKFGDWAIETTKNLTPELWEKMLACEYGGMNESLADLYAATGEKRYLDLARKFYDHRVLDPLAQGIDSLPGKHSNTQIPKIIGLGRLYEVTGEAKDAQTARFFWEQVVKHHSYAIGGNSNHEYLGPPDQLSDRLSTNTAETCNTYNMLRLTRRLFEWEPKAEYADYYERAHLNHILASQNPEDAMMTYFMPLSSGASRGYSDPTHNWTCCHGSGMENHTKHADSVYFHAGKDRLYVNLFIPSEVRWQGQTIRQTTEFPKNGRVALTVESGAARAFEIAFRHPSWAKETLELKVDGKTVATSDQPGSYVVVKRTWKPGDRLEAELPMRLHTEAMPDNPKRIAVLYGPVVLAADLGPDEGEFPRIPVLVTGERPPSDWLSQGAGLEFRTKGVGRPGELVFRPFYAHTHNRYATYFDVFTEEQWLAAEAEYRAEEARQRDLEVRTLDFIRIGEMQPERDHNLKSEKNDVREANGRGFRTPMAGGWFEFDMKVDPSGPNDLVVTYWGSERVRPDFQILVDGQVLAEETLADRPSNRFYDVSYPLAEAATKGKGKIVVRFQGKAGKPAGAVAGARTVRRK